MNKKGKVKRIAAILLLVLIACTFISMLICLIRNAPPAVILAHLFCLMIIPCIFYAMRLLADAIRKRRNDSQT